MRIFLSRPHMSGLEQGFVSEAFKSNFIAPLGPQVDALEKKMAEYLGNGYHCIALSSGTAALHLALEVSGVGEHDDVWVSSMTFAGGVFPVNYLHANPTFFDLSRQTWTLDPGYIEDALKEADRIHRLPKAIIPTDLYGQSVDLDALELIAANFGVNLIVDSAESLGAEHLNGRKAGTGGDAAILSFNGNKIITTSGGGMLVTKHKAWADRARFLATQARDSAPHYEHSTTGYNYRLSNVCAAIGLGQMEVLDSRVNARRQIFERYYDRLTAYGIRFMPEPVGYKSSRWLTAIYVDPKVTGVTREDIRLMLLDNLIESRPLWKPMHLQPVFAGSVYHGSAFDEDLFQNGLCLPSGSDLTESEQDEVVERIVDLIR